MLSVTIPCLKGSPLLSLDILVYMYGHFCCEAVLACTFMYLHAFTGTRGGAATGGGTGAAGRPPPRASIALAVYISL